MKLHLGCGQRYFEGYINIDYPLTEHSVQTTSVADQHANLLEIHYAPESIKEVRLHHVFEHFSRAQACALVASWNSWLAKGGILHIEVPDFKKTAQVALSNFSSVKQKAVALRHIFGSQEAHWAVHYEGYTAKSLAELLRVFGFSLKESRKNYHLGTYNIELIVQKNEQLNRAAAVEIAKKYLSNFMVADVASEQVLLATWLNDFSEQLNKSYAR
jgi:predicted SAM-dependent methyltransferase